MSVTVTNIMADGTECTDLSHYLDTHDLPETVKCIIRQIMTQDKSVQE